MRERRLDGCWIAEPVADEGEQDVQELDDLERAHASTGIHHSMNSWHRPSPASRITHRLL